MVTGKRSPPPVVPLVWTMLTPLAVAAPDATSWAEYSCASVFVGTGSDESSAVVRTSVGRRPTARRRSEYAGTAVAGSDTKSARRHRGRRRSPRPPSTSVPESPRGSRGTDRCRASAGFASRRSCTRDSATAPAAGDRSPRGPWAGAHHTAAPPLEAPGPPAVRPGRFTAFVAFVAFVALVALVALGGLLSLARRRRETALLVAVPLAAHARDCPRLSGPPEGDPCRAQADPPLRSSGGRKRRVLERGRLPVRPHRPESRYTRDPAGRSNDREQPAVPAAHGSEVFVHAERVKARG